MTRQWIVIGDLTTHGGRVVSGSQFTDVDGKPVARIGDYASCPKCGGPQRIISGDQTIMVDGQPVARDWDYLECGAQLISTQQSRTFVEHGLSASAAGGSFGSWFPGVPPPGSAEAIPSDDELAAAAYGDPVYWTAQVGSEAVEARRVSALDGQVVDSIMASEGASGEQGGRLEAYGFRQGNGHAYEDIMAARSHYGQGSAEERAVAAKYLNAAARSAGALNFTDPGKQAAIMSMAHMRGVAGAQAIINSMESNEITQSGSLTAASIAQAEAMSPADFQQRLQHARIAYDRQIYGPTTTTVRGQQHNWWDYFGRGLQDRYAAEAEQFRRISAGQP